MASNAPVDRPIPDDVIRSPHVPPKGPTVGRQPFNVAACHALSQRIRNAAHDGAVNIAVGAEFLQELLAAAQYAMQNGWQSTKEI